MSCDLNIHVDIFVQRVPKYSGEYSQESLFYLNSGQFYLWDKWRSYAYSRFYISNAVLF